MWIYYNMFLTVQIKEYFNYWLPTTVEYSIYNTDTQKDPK